MMSYIELRRIRDFNQTLHAATEYLRQNFAILSKATLALVLPLLLVGLVTYNIGAYYLTSYFGGYTLSDSSANMDMMVFVMAWSMMGVFFFLSLGMIVNTAVLYEHMRLYSMTNEPDLISLGDVLRQIKRKAWLYIRTTIGLYFVFSLLYTISIIALTMIVALLGFFAEAIGAFLGMLFFFLAMAYSLIVISMIYIVRTVEGTHFFTAFSRCFTLVRSNFWTTLGIYLITYLLISSISSLSLWFGAGLGSWVVLLAIELPAWLLTSLITVFEIIYISVYLIINSLGMLVVAFRYFSLVEQREAVGLLRKIELICNDEY